MKHLKVQRALQDTYRGGSSVSSFLKRMHLRFYKLFHFHSIWLVQVLVDWLSRELTRETERIEQVFHDRLSLQERKMDLLLKMQPGADAAPSASPSVRKELNSLTALTHLLRRDEVLTSMPVIINLAGSSRCNLSCIMCARHVTGHEKSNRLAPLPASILKDFADQTFPQAKYLRLNTSGEPLLSPTLELELDCARRHAVEILLITNGTHPDLGMWDRIVPQCAAMDISVDAATPETYEAIRMGGRFSILLRNLAHIRSRAFALPPTERPRLHLGMTLMRRNLRELHLMVALTKLLGFDGLRTSYMTSFSPEMNSEVLAPADPEVTQVLSRAAALASGFGLSLELPPPAVHAGDPRPVWAAMQPQMRDLMRRLQEAGMEDTPDLEPDADPAPENTVRGDAPWGDHFRAIRRTEEGAAMECPFLWEQMFIDNDARLFTCCEPSHPVAGDFRKDTAARIWNNGEYRRRRANFNPRSAAYGRHPRCAACASRGFLLNNF